MDDKLFFPVNDLKLQDLYDWSIPKEVCHTKTGTVKNVKAHQSCQTGSLVQVNEAKVALFRLRDKVYAINEKCPHAGGPLHLGDIESLPDMSLCVRCPWHSWRFDLNTGQVKRPKGRGLCATVYPTKVLQDGSILVGFNEIDPKYFTDENF